MKVGMELCAELLDTPKIYAAAPPEGSVDFVTSIKQKMSEIGSILPCYPCNNGPLHVWSISESFE
jgi:hypothetical protein